MSKFYVFRMFRKSLWYTRITPVFFIRHRPQYDGNLGKRFSIWCTFNEIQGRKGFLTPCSAYVFSNRPVSILREIIADEVTFWRECMALEVGCAIAQAASRWLPTAVARVRARVRSCGICGGQNGTGAGFVRVLRFPLPIFIPPIPIAPQPSLSIIWGRSTKCTQSHPH
jgi:hypothetical protein